VSRRILITGPGPWRFPPLPCGCNAAVSRNGKWYRKEDCIRLKDGSKICVHGKRWVVKWIEQPVQKAKR